MICTTQTLSELATLVEKLKEKNFDINTQYKFIKLSKVIKDEKEYVNEQQFYLLKQYAEKDDNGKFIIKEDGGIKIKDNCIQEFGLKLIEMNKRKITLPDIYFSLDEL